MAATAGTDNQLWGPRFFALSGALLCALLPFSAYNALLSLIRAEWAMSNLQASSVYSAYLLGAALSALVLVPLSDRWPAARLWLVGLTLMCTAQLLFVVASPSPWPAAFWRFLTGAGYILAYTSGVKLMASLVPDRRATAVGFFVAAGYAGTTGSFLLTGQMLRLTQNWHSAYLIVSLLAWLALPLAWLAVRRFPHEGTVPGARRSGRLDLSLLRDAAIRRSVTAYAWHTADLYIARLWIPLLLATMYLAQGMNDTAAAARGASVAGVMFMVSAAAVFAGGWLADRVGRVDAAIGLFAVSIAASAVVGWLSAVPLLLLGVAAVYAVASAADSSIYATLLIEQAPPDRIGSAQAIQSFIGFGVGALWPVVSGQFLDMTAGRLGWGGVFTLNALAVTFGLLALVRMRRAAV